MTMHKNQVYLKDVIGHHEEDNTIRWNQETLLNGVWDIIENDSNEYGSILFVGRGPLVYAVIQSDQKIFDHIPTEHDIESFDKRILR